MKKTPVIAVSALVVLGCTLFLLLALPFDFGAAVSAQQSSAIPVDVHALPVLIPNPALKLNTLPDAPLELQSGSITVPITIDNYSSTPRTNDVTRTFFTFAKDALTGTPTSIQSKIQVLDETQTPIPVYATIASRWDGPASGSNSIKLVWLDFPVNVSANATQTYYVRYNNNGGLSSISPSAALNVVTQNIGGVDKYVVTAGNQTFHINQQRFKVFDFVSIGSNTIVSGASTDGYYLELDAIAEVASRTLASGSTSVIVNHPEALAVNDQFTFEHVDFLSAAESIGSTGINVTYPIATQASPAVALYQAGMQIRIGAGAQQETRTIQSISASNRILFSPALQFAHALNEPVSIINFSTHTITGISGNTINFSPATAYPMVIGYGIRKVSGAKKLFSSSAPNAGISIAEVEEQNPLRTTIHLVGTLAEVGGTKTLNDIELEVRYHIFYNGMVDMETSLVNRGSRGIYYIQLSNNSYPPTQDLIFDQAYIKSSINLPGASKTIHFGSLPVQGSSSVAPVMDTFSSNTTYTLTQDLYPAEIDVYNRTPYSPSEKSNNRLLDNFYGSVKKQVGASPVTTLYQNLGQEAPNYICASGCQFTSQNNIPIVNQPGLRFENAIGLGDGTQGVAILPHYYFWEEAPFGFSTDGQSIQIISHPPGIASGVKRVGEYITGPFGAEDYLYPKYRLFGAERNTTRSSFRFFGSGESLPTQMDLAQARRNKLLPRNTDYVQSTRAFFGVTPYYTHNQLASIAWGPLQNAVTRYIKSYQVITDWTVSDPNSVNAAPIQGVKRSKFDYNFRTGKGYTTVAPYGKQRVGTLERGDSSDGLAYSNLYEWLKVLMLDVLKEDISKPELYYWINLFADAQLNNHGTLQFSPGKDPSFYNGQTLYERGTQYLKPDGSHFWQEGQTLYAFMTGDALSREVTARWYEEHLIPGGVAIGAGTPSAGNCDSGKSRENGWPASNAVGRYSFTGEAALLTAAENLVHFVYQCTRPPINADLALNFDPNPSTPLYGIDKIWMDNTDMRAAARLLTFKQQAGTLNNDPRDGELITYLNKAADFLAGTTPNFQSVYGYGLPFSFGSGIGYTEIGTESSPTHYTKAVACSAYPSIGVFTNPAQIDWPGSSGRGIHITNGCVDLYQWVNGNPLQIGDYQGARIVSNGYHSSTLSFLYYALQNIPGQNPSTLIPTVLKRLARDGILYLFDSTSAACGPGNVAGQPATGPAGGQVNLNDPNCYSPVRGRDDQFAGAVFKSLPEAMAYDETLWVVNNVLDCAGLGGQFCGATQQCAGTLTPAVGTGGLATCCVQPTAAAPVPQLCVNDTFAPQLSNFAPPYGMIFGLTQVQLSLTTNENATCYYTQNLGYSFPSSGVPSIPAMSTTGTTTHSTLITNLPQPGSVTYRIFCRDPANNVGASNHTITVLPAGQQPFSITNILVTPASSTATVSWDTTVPTTGSVQYGPITGLEFTATDSTLSGSHALVLMNLTPSTNYHYHIIATDAYTNNLSTNFSTFTTQAQAVNVTLVNSHYTQAGNTEESSMQSNPNNYDKQYPGLQVGFDNSSFSGKNRALLRFDLSSIPSTLNLNTFTATLQMRVSAAQGGAGLSPSVQVFPITSSAPPGFGDESATTAVGESTWRRRVQSSGLWTNCPSTISGAAASSQCGAESDYATGEGVSTAVPDSVGSNVTWDVTPIVRAWLDSTRPNYGFLLRSQDESGVINLRKFTSNNDNFTSPSANTPRLIIAGTTAESGGIPICSNGQTQFCTVGVCAGTQQTCVNNVWGACDTSGVINYQSSETSCTDGLDNDCDAAVDCSDSQCAAQPICLSNVCGNLVCEVGESCSSCSQDCSACAPPLIVMQSPAPSQVFAYGAGIPFQGTITNADPNESLFGALIMHLGSNPNVNAPGDIILQTPPFTSSLAGVALGFTYAPSPPLGAGTYYWQTLVADSAGIISTPVQSFTVQSPSASCSGIPPLCAQQQGVCAGSVQACVSGSFVACLASEYGSSFQSSESSCGDGLDNDCDGLTDCSDIGCSLASACVLCGNGACASGETCSTCSLDCGPCANATTGGTNTGGGGGGGGGSGGNSTATNPSNSPAIGNITLPESPSPDSSSTASNIETGNPITNVLASMGQTVVSALSSDAASNLTMNLLAGMVVLVLALSLIAYFMGWI